MWIIYLLMINMKSALSYSDKYEIVVQEVLCIDIIKNITYTINENKATDRRLVLN